MIVFIYKWREKYVFLTAIDPALRFIDGISVSSFL